MGMTRARARAVKASSAAGVAVLVAFTACTPKKNHPDQPTSATSVAQVSGAQAVRATATPESPKAAAMLTIQSDSFAHQSAIPKKYTCEGPGISPPLKWSQVPTAAKSLALIVDDPDAPDPKAPQRTWVHWVLYDIPPATTELAEAVKELPQGTRQGQNDWHRTGYGAPCPPIGRHRYFFKLYALDAVLPDLHEPSEADLQKAMSGHVIAHGELVGTYQKSGK
jgi:Raf kinase inhibitor-like YbhB/YbcL family protein